MIVQIFCVLAEHERNVLRERTRLGLTAARARGRTGGRPTGLVPKYENIKHLVKASYNTKAATIEEIMNAYKIGSKSTLYKILKSA